MPQRNAPDGSGEVLDFLRKLWAVDHELQSFSKRMHERLGVTGPQRLVLRAIGRTPNATAGLIAQLLSIDPSTLTGVLKRLEKRKLVLRSRDSKDGRRALFRLTAAGKRVERIRSGTVEAAVHRAAGRVGPANLAATCLTLEVLASELARDQRLPRRRV